MAATKNKVGRGTPFYILEENIEFILTNEPYYTQFDMAARLGVSSKGIYHQLKRYGRLDLWRKMINNHAERSGVNDGGRYGDYH